MCYYERANKSKINCVFYCCNYCICCKFNSCKYYSDKKSEFSFVFCISERFSAKSLVFVYFLQTKWYNFSATSQRKKKHPSHNLTKESLWRHFAQLAVPLISGNILPQFYNTIDASPAVKHFCGISNIAVTENGELT